MYVYKEIDKYEFVKESSIALYILHAHTVTCIRQVKSSYILTVLVYMYIDFVIGTQSSKMLVQLCQLQGLQILSMSGVSLTSASQILESFWSIWSEVSR